MDLAKVLIFAVLQISLIVGVSAVSSSNLDHIMNSSIENSDEGLVLEEDSEWGFILYDIEPLLEDRDSVVVDVVGADQGTVLLELYLNRPNSGQGGIEDEVAEVMEIEGYEEIKIDEEVDEFNSLRLSIEREDLSGDSPAITEVTLHEKSVSYYWIFALVIVLVSIFGVIAFRRKHEGLE